MPVELTLNLATLFGFLLVLARVSGVVAFVPLPGMQSAPEVTRIILALALTFTLIGEWPAPDPNAISVGSLFGWIAAELSFGLIVGVAVNFLFDGLQMAAQMIGLQAGYSYASTVDPSTQADSGVLQIVTQLLAGLLFFVMGFDREIIRILAYSLEKVPTGSYFTAAPVMTSLVQLGSGIFVIGLRLALPVVALLLLVDISFTIVGKVHAQLQLLSLSFSLKMLAGLTLLATGLSVFPLVLQKAASHTFETLIKIVSR